MKNYIVTLLKRSSQNVKIRASSEILAREKVYEMLSKDEVDHNRFEEVEVYIYDTNEVE